MKQWSREFLSYLGPDGASNGGTEASAQYLYLCSEEWAPDMPGVSVHPFDRSLGVSWPIEVDPADPAQISAKDAALPTLEEIRLGRPVGDR